MNKIQPQAIDSEKALLGSLMQDNEICDEIMPMIVEEMFYHDNHKFIFRAMELLYRNNEPIDQLTVVEKLHELKLLDEIGGAFNVANIINRVPTSANANHYFKIVNTAYKRRMIIKISNEAIGESYEGEIEIDTVIDTLQAKLNSESKEEMKAYGMKELIMSMDNDRNQFMKTGFSKFDLYYDGLTRKELSIIGGRPSQGKSSFAMSTMLQMAKMGFNVLFFSLEMSKEIVINRFVSMESEIDHALVKRKRIEQNDRAIYLDALSTISSLPIKVIELSSLSIYDIKAKTRQFVRKGLCDIIFIDYLQIMKLLGKNETTSEKLGMITRESKAMAKELNIHVSILSQFRRTEKRPELIDLRSSGEIEQDADMVMFPYRPNSMKKDEDQSFTELIMAKNRNGATGYYEDIKWFPTIVKFKEQEYI